MDRGDEQVDKGDLDGALASYRAAHELMHVPTTGLEVARTFAKLGKLVEGRDAALEVLHMPAKPRDPRPFKVARAAAESLARELAPQIPSLRLELTPKPEADQTSLEIDQRSVPLAAVGLAYALNPGEHRIQVAVNGYRTIVREISLPPGETQTLHVDLVPLPKPKVAVQKAPAASPAPSAAARPAPEVPALSDPLGSAIPPAPAARSSTWPQWLGFSLGGAGLVAGSVAGLLSLDRARAAQNYCDGNVCPPEARRDRDMALTMANISNVAFGVALLGTGIGLTSWLLSDGAPPPSSQASVTGMRFVATPSVAAVRVEGAFW